MPAHADPITTACGRTGKYGVPMSLSTDDARPAAPMRVPREIPKDRKGSTLKRAENSRCLHVPGALAARHLCHHGSAHAGFALSQLYRLQHPQRAELGRPRQLHAPVHDGPAFHQVDLGDPDLCGLVGAAGADLFADHRRGAQSRSARVSRSTARSSTSPRSSGRASALACYGSRCSASAASSTISLGCSAMPGAAGSTIPPLPCPPSSPCMCGRSVRPW